MSKRLEVVRVLVTERLSEAAEEIFQLFVSTLAEYEHEFLWAKGVDDSRARTPGETEEAAESGRSAAGVQSVSCCGGAVDTQVHIYIKEDPDLCLKQEPGESEEPEEPEKPLAVLSVLDGERGAENQRIVEFGDADAEDALAVHLEKETHNNAFAIVDSNDLAEFIHPRMFYFPDVASLAWRSDKTLPDGSRGTKKETKQHKCAQCGKVYLHRPSLFRHILTHKEQKPFKCSVCQKGFSQKPHLTVHMRIHTGEKPFSCPFCAKTFSNKSNVSQHLRVHTGERPFACSVCGARFRCTKTLSTHMAVHMGEWPLTNRGLEKMTKRDKQVTESDEKRQKGDYKRLNASKRLQKETKM